MKLKKLHIFFVACLLLAAACEEEISIIENPDLIFTNSFPVHIPPYEYRDQENRVITVRGDSSYLSSVIDTLTNQPVLSWEGLTSKIVSVAIFTEPIEVSHGEIYSGNVVWRWNSGMAAEENNRIKFSEGREVRAGIILDKDQVPAPLDTGHYYWGVWSWRQSGTKILYSSRQLEFYVPN